MWLSGSDNSYPYAKAIKRFETLNFLGCKDKPFCNSIPYKKWNKLDRIFRKCYKTEDSGVKSV